MVGKLNVNCTMNGSETQTVIFVGEPKEGNGPIQNQVAFLGKERNCVIPADFVKKVTDLFKLAQENGVSFEELCVYSFAGQIETQQQGGNG